MGHYNLTKMPKSFFFANNSIQNCHSRENILCVFLNMIMAVGLTVSKIDRGQRSDGSDHDVVNYNSLIKMQNIGPILLNLSVYQVA